VTSSRGLYLVLEGGDASGKSQQAQMLIEWLRAQGATVRHLREPGSTATGEALRRLLLDPETGDLSPFTEALLFSAARAEMLRVEVAPAVAAGEVVLVERCYLSTLVYQGIAVDQPLDVLQAVTKAVHADLWPDCIFLLDVDEATRQTRAQAAGKADRIEERAGGFHARVQQGYRDVSDARVVMVDARGSLDAVQSELRSRIKSLLDGES